ncbi:MAG TPA: hypothetical protein VGG02_05045 [Chthoniobacterales bacterium]|jgi:hypothetical protein
MVQIIEPAEQQANRLKDIRRIEGMREELRAMRAFSAGTSYASKPLPFSLSDATFDHLDAHLVDELVRLRTSVTP